MQADVCFAELCNNDEYILGVCGRIIPNQSYLDSSV